MKFILLITILTLNANVGFANECVETSANFSIANSLKEALGIDGGFSTSLRVEKKSTNLAVEAENFLEFIPEQLSSVESFVLRDEPSRQDQVLVTSTNYPFSREVQNSLGARIRLRDYGERPKGSRDRFTPQNPEMTSLEIKAKTELDGVVVKPILKIPVTLLKDLFGSLEQFSANKEHILSEILRTNNNPRISQLVVEIIESFHRLAHSRGETTAGINVEYQRRAFVLNVLNRSNAQMHKVQLTFDQFVEMRQANAQRSPYENSENTITHRYPTEPGRAITTVEMKTDLQLDALYRSNPEFVKSNLPAYFAIRTRFEQMQTRPPPGFSANSGKAALLNAFRND